MRKQLYNILTIILLNILFTPILNLYGQDCEPPYDLSAIEVTATTALLRWENDNYYYGQNTLFHIVVSPSELDDPTSVPVPVEVQGSSMYMTHLIEDLTPATDYYFYVWAVCGTENSDWDEGTFRTRCTSKDIPYRENFNDYVSGPSSFPSCWIQIRGTAYTANIDAEHANVLQLHSYSRVALPSFNSPINSLRIHFSVMAFSTTAPLFVGIIEDPEDWDTYTPIDTITPSTEYTFEDRSVYFNNYNGQGQYIVFYNTGSSIYNIDNIEVSAIPNCLSPTGLQASDILPNSATLSWEEAGTATQWQTLLSTTPITDFSTQTPSVRDTTVYFANSLTPNTCYHFYVRALCSDENSEWAAFSFTTPCTPSLLPSAEHFDADQLPGCWGIEHVVGTADLNIVESGNYPACYPASGTSMVQWECRNYGEGWQTRLKSIPLNTTGASALNVNFKWHHDLSNSNGSGDGVQIQYSTDGTTWTNSTQGIIHRYDGIHNGWTEYNVIVPEAGNNPLVYIGFLFSSGSNSSNCYLDEVNFTATSSCFTPVNVRVDNISGNGATLSWDEVGSATAWHVLISPTPVTDFSNISPVTVTDTSYTPNNLNPVTTYYAYVRAKCATNTFSEWTTAITFTTECGLLSVLPHTESFDNDGTCTNAFPPCWIRHGIPELGTFIHNGQVCRTPSATDLDAIDGDKSLLICSPSSCYTYTITPPLRDDIRDLSVTFFAKQSSNDYSGTLEVGVMSNPNDPLTFESIATIQPETAGEWELFPISFTLANLTGSGNRIAFRHYGMIDDHYYLIDGLTILKTPDCWPALFPSVDGITGNSATLSWIDANNPSAQWHVKVSDTPMTDMRLTANVFDQTIPTSSLTLDYLAGNTTYYYYIQSECGNAVANTWTQDSFTTLPCNCYVEIYMRDQWANTWEGAKIQLKHGTTVFAEASMTHNGTRDTARIYTCEALTIDYYFVSGNYDSDISFTIVNSLGSTLYTSSGTPQAGRFYSGVPACGVSCGTAPGNLTATMTAAGHHLTWEAAPDALSYSVYRNNILLAEYVTATSYTDTEPNDGDNNNCYTVTAKCIVGESGPSNESCVTGIADREPTHAVSIFPNPAKDRFTVSTNFPIRRICVVNLLGQEISSREVTGSRVEINVSGLPNGLYLVKIWDGSNWLVRKIIVE